MPTDIVDQPPPVASNHPASWDLVIADVETLYARFASLEAPDAHAVTHATVISEVLADMRARDKLGFERYGTRLQAGNGRNHLVDAYQEALDLIVYVRTEMVERPRTSLTVLYWSTINHALLIRDIIGRE